ncbi:PH domain-containing protein, partial [Oerskovia douganii]|uniref:PH domain-containing protein n=1 Tax=Oerskovia douganii TaxID=2762210 RepID=UPI00187B46E9
MGPTKVFCSMYGRVLTIATAVIAVLATAVQVREDAGGALLTLAWGALVTCGVWVLFWRPRVEVSDGGIDVRNPLRTVHVPWTAYENVRTQWSLEVGYTGGSVTAWAAPRSSSSGQWLRTWRRRPTEAGSTRVGGASAEVVAAEITERHAALVMAGYLAEARPGAPGARSTWNVVELAALGSLAGGGGGG